MTGSGNAAADIEEIYRRLEALGEGRNAVAGVLALLPDILAWIDRTPVADETPTSFRVYNSATVALLHHQMGARALPLAERARELTEHAVGDRHHLTLTSWELLASAYNQAGQPARAVRLLERVVAAHRALAGPDDPAVWHAMVNLGGALLAADRYDEALAVLDDLEGYRMRTVGPHHLDTLMTRHNRAVILDRAGRRAEALAIWEGVVPDMERHLGPEDPDTIDVRDSLLQARRAAARTEAAASAAGAAGEDRDADAARGAEPGRDPESGRGSGRGADAAGGGGRIRDGVFFDDVDEVRLLARANSASRGEGDLSTLAARVRFASALRNRGRLDEARTSFTEVLADCARILGDGHPLTLDARGRLAFTRQVQGELAEAAAEFEALLVDCQRELGRSTFLTIQAASCLIVLYGQLDRTRDAEGLLDGWHAEIIEVLGFEHELTRLILAQRTLRQFGIDEL